MYILLEKAIQLIMGFYNKHFGLNNNTLPGVPMFVIHLLVVAMYAGVHVCSACPYSCVYTDHVMCIYIGY